MEKEREEEKEEKNMNEDEWKEEEGDDEETREKKRKKREERARKRLNRGISEEEVNKAIDQLRNFRTPGKDGVIGEILKEGGGKIRKAVWMMCCAAWKNESAPGLDARSCFSFAQRWRGEGSNELPRHHIAKHCREGLQSSAWQSADVLCRKRGFRNS